MYCSECGKRVPDDALTCDNCGAVVRSEPAVKTEFKEPEQIGGITLGDDGKYRWIYELHLLKSPMIYFLVWKIFFFIFLGIFTFMTVLNTFEQSHYFTNGFSTDLKAYVYIFIGMTVVTGLGYLLYAAMMGGKYIVLFEMDEHGVNHKQITKQAKKAQKIAGATVLAGLLTGNLTTVGVGLNATRTEMYSDFAKTRKVKAKPANDLIKVNGRLQHNQVYAAKEDFAFVKDFIVSHCPNLK